MPPRTISSSMTVRKACAVLNFPNPPTGPKELKKRFIQLAKTHHPDLHETEASKIAATEKMANVTEAYKLLKSLIDNRTAGGKIGGSSAAASASPQHHWETDASGQNFSAPGIAKSSSHMWLPWQRTGPSRVVDTEKVLESSPDFWSFKASVRRVEQRAAETEKHLGEAGSGEAKTPCGSESDWSSSGTATKSKADTFAGSQYSSQHFQSQRRTSSAVKGTAPRKSLLELLKNYWAAKGIGRLMQSVRFIISGK